ncbi:ABC transporter-like protein 12 [Leptotrombidium deliense]|uniref:ABC transporter-like protein 12 n=1 Tax=Leptotrombidium deliense TaxID=299467 RepID=A0A443SLE9_9ACAR|nr:ABC transporter-like protein 12 [Leptotrombidium deliense]
MSISPTSEVIEECHSSDFEIYWNRLNYSVDIPLTTRILRKFETCKSIPKVKSILRDMSGSAQSGQLTGFLGPSGCGKSSLLECLVGKRMKGKTGDICITGEKLVNQKITLSFIAQQNDLLKYLTVRETILFAAKIQIATKVLEGELDPLLAEDENLVFTSAGGNEYCSMITDRMINQLGLQVCEHNRISSCSGGQLKRVAIAQALIVKPRILVLDEPTSGLDSVSCLQVINILHTLARSNPSVAVLATIHQPSQKVLNLFDKIYVIAESGECIFENSPSQIIPHLEKFGSKCPQQFNPADFIMEIACGEHGSKLCNQLAFAQKVQFDNYRNSNEFHLTSMKLSDFQHEIYFPTSKHTWFLFQRNLLVTLRDPIVFAFRMGTTMATALFLTDLFGTQIGVRGGCPPKLDADFEPSHLDEIGDDTEDELKSIYNNTGNLMFTVFFFVFNALMPTLVSFPIEMHVMKAEVKNNWYSVTSFFKSKLFAETPIHLLMTLLYVPLQFWLQSQHAEMWRFLVVFFIILLLQFIAQTLGYITGAVFMNNIPACVFLGPNFWFIPFVIVCGLFIKVKSMSIFFRILSFTSFFRFAMEAIIVTIYGFDRCGTEIQKKLIEGKEAFVIWMSAMLGIYGDGSDSDSNATALSAPTETFVTELIELISGDFTSDKNEVRSASMNIYNYEDWYLYRALFMLILYLILLRLFALYCISVRVKSES